MSATKDYVIWFMEKYGDLDEDDGFSKAWEFFADDLDEKVLWREDDPPEHDVFLSYSWDDKDAARQLVGELVKVGLRVWFDEQAYAGDDIRGRLIVYRLLHAGIATSLAGLALVTRSFLTKQWTLHETRGLHRHGRLRAVIVDGVDRDEALAVLDADPAGVLVLDRARLSPPELAARVALEVRGTT